MEIISPILFTIIIWRLYKYLKPRIYKYLIEIKAKKVESQMRKIEAEMDKIDKLSLKKWIDKESVKINMISLGSVLKLQRERGHSPISEESLARYLAFGTLFFLSPDPVKNFRGPGKEILEENFIKELNEEQLNNLRWEMLVFEVFNALMVINSYIRKKELSTEFSTLYSKTLYEMITDQFGVEIPKRIDSWENVNKEIRIRTVEYESYLVNYAGRDMMKYANRLVGSFYKNICGSSPKGYFNFMNIFIILINTMEFHSEVIATTIEKLKPYSNLE
jgi:hypothetical protein